MSSDEEKSGLPSSISREDIEKYVTCMEEIKQRGTAIIQIIAKETTTTFPATNIEFCCLQIRKILELIALASISANKEEYVRQHANFLKHYRAKDILKCVEKVNPNFYPKPFYPRPDPDHNEIQGYLNRQDFENVYDACKTVLHASNPYGATIDYAQVERQIPEWMGKIKILLKHHYVHLIHKNQQLWVIMKSPQNGNVQASVWMRLGDVGQPPQ
jgi:hypothetical protein